MMTAKTLEEEAEKAAFESNESTFKEEEAFYRGYLAAATARDKEIEELRERVKELEGMVPKWVPVAQKIALDIQGWLPIEDQKCGDDERQWLMVPPIPMPEKGSE